MKGPTKNQTSSTTGWLLRMRIWRMSLQRTKSAIISWDGSNHVFYCCCLSTFVAVATLNFNRLIMGKNENWHLLLFHYAPNFEETAGVYWKKKSEVWHILWTVHARALTFHIWIPHGKIVDPNFFFLSELSPFLELCPFEKIRMKSCQQDITKSIWATGLKHGQLIGDNE